MFLILKRSCVKTKTAYHSVISFANSLKVFLLRYVLNSVKNLITFVCAYRFLTFIRNDKLYDYVNRVLIHSLFGLFVTASMNSHIYKFAYRFIPNVLSSYLPALTIRLYIGQLR